MTDTNQVTEHQIPIEWDIPENLVSRYATNMVVQAGNHEYIIMFFELREPLLMGTPTDIEATLEATKSVRAHCVARVIVAQDRLKDFAAILQEIALRGAEPGFEESE